MQVFFKTLRLFFTSSLCDVTTALPVRKAGRLKGPFCSRYEYLAYNTCTLDSTKTKKFQRVHCRLLPIVGRERLDSA